MIGMIKFDFDRTFPSGDSLWPIVFDGVRWLAVCCRETVLQLFISGISLWLLVW